MQAQIGSADLKLAKNYVDSVAALVRDGILEFGKAAAEL